MEWLTAYQARLMLSPALGDSTATKVLCERARDGLIKTLARPLIIEKGQENERFDDDLLPPRFWWAGNGQALSQSWLTGDFSTQVKRKRSLSQVRDGGPSQYKWTAYNVGFEKVAVEQVAQHLEGYLATRQAIEAASQAPSNPSLEVDQRSKGGRKPDAQKWANFAAAMLALTHEEGINQEGTASDLYKRVADYAMERGHEVIHYSNCTAALNLALQWAKGLGIPKSS